MSFQGLYLRYYRKCMCLFLEHPYILVATSLCSPHTHLRASRRLTGAILIFECSAPQTPCQAGIRFILYSAGDLTFNLFDFYHRLFLSSSSLYRHASGPKTMSAQRQVRSHLCFFFIPSLGRPYYYYFFYVKAHTQKLKE